MATHSDTVASCVTRGGIISLFLEFVSFEEFALGEGAVSWSLLTLLYCFLLVDDAIVADAVETHVFVVCSSVRVLKGVQVPVGGEGLFGDLRLRNCLHVYLICGLLVSFVDICCLSLPSIKFRYEVLEQQVLSC